MINLRSFNVTRIISMATILLLTACGGGGGSSATNDSGFTASSNNNPITNTKPQTSSVSESSNQSTYSMGSSSVEVAATSSEISQSTSSKSTSKASSHSNTSSNSSSSRITIDVLPPTMIPNIHIDFTEYDLAVFSWAAATDNVGVTSYKIYRNQVQIDQIDVIDLIYADFTVAPDNTYTYGVSAGDAVGNWSPIKTILTKTQPQPAPPSPTSSSNASSKNSSQLSSLSSSSSSSSISKSSSLISNPSSSSRSNNSSSSAASLDKTSPSAPGSISQILASATRVDIRWASATDNIGVTSYKIYRDNILIGTLGAGILEYSDKTTEPNKTYTYSVEAGDAAANWSLSRKTIAITTPSVTPVGDITLYWAPPTQRDDGTTITTAELGGFLIKYKSKADTHYTFLDITDGSAKSHIISNVNSEYDFQIAAYDSNDLYSAFVAISPR